MKDLYLHLYIRNHDDSITYEADIKVDDYSLDLPCSGRLSIRKIDEDGTIHEGINNVIYLNKPFFRNGYDADYIIISYFKEPDVMKKVTGINISEWHSYEDNRETESERYVVDFINQTFESHINNYKVEIRVISEIACEIYIDGKLLGELNPFKHLIFKDTAKYALRNTEDSVLEFGKEIYFTMSYE